jgi:hypothetical protein
LGVVETQQTGRLTMLSGIAALRLHRLNGTLVSEALMRILRVLLLSAAAMATIGVSTARAENWMFRRSYYSHGEAPFLGGEMSQNRTIYREPWVGAHPRFAIRGGWRFNTFTLQNGNGSVDRTYFRENWYDLNY